MKEIPRLQPIVNCVKVRENYRDVRGRLHYIWFNPKDKQIMEGMRLKIDAINKRLVSRIYYDNKGKTIFTEMF